MKTAYVSLAMWLAVCVAYAGTALQDEIDAANALRGSERMAARTAIATEHGPAVYQQALAAELISNTAERVLQWYLDTNADGLTLARAIIDAPRNEGDFRARRQAARRVALDASVTDDEVLPLAGFIGNTRMAATIARERSWDVPAGQTEFLVDWMAANAHTVPSFNYREAFRVYISVLSPAAALPVLENEIRSVLLIEPSPERDEWIKELRAQHVILRDLAGN